MCAFVAVSTLLLSFAPNTLADESSCPSIADGSHPYCECRYGDKYDIETHQCPNPQCPTNSTTESKFPDCDCSGVGKNYDYSTYLNECFLVCPENSTG